MDIPKQAFKWRMQTWIVLVIGLLAILVALVASFASATFRPTTPVKVGQSGVFSLWVADTRDSLYQGLSGVKELPRNGGLLMDFKVSGFHGIVMRGMKVPLDVVWVDESKQVVHIVKNIPADRSEEDVFVSKKPARYVLELPAGAVDRSAMKVGNVAEFKLQGEQ